jgi:hypothetical protein
MIYKLSDDLGWASVKAIKGSFLCLIKSVLLNLAVTVFAPTPVLYFSVKSELE